MKGTLKSRKGSISLFACIAIVIVASLATIGINQTNPNLMTGKTAILGNSTSDECMDQRLQKHFTPAEITQLKEGSLK